MVIDTGFIVFTMIFLLIAAIVTSFFIGALLDKTGYFAKKKTMNWVESEKIKAANVDTLKITGSRHSYND